MSATKNHVKSNLRIKYVDGQNKKGEDICKWKSFSNLKMDATAEKISNVSDSMSKLIPKGIVITMVEESYIIG